jgi:hypothetical protein
MKARASALCCIAALTAVDGFLSVPACRSSALPIAAAGCRKACSHAQALHKLRMTAVPDAASDTESSSTIPAADEAAHQQHNTQKARPTRLRRRLAHIAASFAVVGAGAPLISQAIRSVLMLYYWRHRPYALCAECLHKSNTHCCMLYALHFMYTGRLLPIRQQL